MAINGSLTPDISESLPVAFAGNPEAVVTPPKFVVSDSAWDVGVADQAFLLAASKENPYKRQSAEVSKQQLDTSKEAGEQTLNQWWLRSQTSWHHGAGINFYEPASDEATQYRYDESLGIDVWTEGQLSLLHKMDGATGQAGGASSASATTAASTTVVVAGVSKAVLVHAGVISVIQDAGNPSYSSHSLNNVGNAVAVGTRVFISHAGGISAFDVPTGSLSLVWNQSPGSTPFIGYAKSRLIAAVDHKIYELPLAGGAIGTDQLYYTHPDATFRWTGFTDSPSAILGAGNSGGTGLVYRFTLGTTQDGSTPKLSYPEQIGELPPGETVHSIANYLGAFVALGTARGVRIGSFSEYYSSFSYGPLTVETALPVYALAARDRFAYGAITNGIDGRTGAVRIDLSVQVSEGRYAWAWDAQTHAAGQADSIAFVGSTGRVVVGIRGFGHYVQSAIAYEASGYLTSGKIRFATTETKAFRLVQVRTQTQSGKVTVYAVSNSGDRSVVTLNDATNTNDDIDVSSNIAPTEYAAFRLQLSPGTGNAASPLVESFTVKALPAPKRQRLIQYPLMCFDGESDRNNVRHGHRGAAWERLRALEQLEEDQTVVLIQDFTTGESFQAAIESIAFTREASPQRKLDNFGGIITLTVRKLL